MRQQQEGHLEGRDATPLETPVVDAAATRAVRGGAGSASASPEHVPSDQLWHAAIRAALQAAATAAELRRALRARRAAGSDDPRAVA